MTKINEKLIRAAADVTIEVVKRVSKIHGEAVRAPSEVVEAQEVVKESFKAYKKPSPVAKVNWYSHNYAASSQIYPQHIGDIAKQGFKTILALRPDGEDPGQPSTDALAREAHQHGIKLHYVPISHDKEAADPLPDFKIALAKSEGPVLAYCRSGQRAARAFHQASPWNSGISAATIVGKLYQEYQQEQTQWF